MLLILFCRNLFIQYILKLEFFGYFKKANKEEPALDSTSPTDKNGLLLVPQAS